MNPYFLLGAGIAVVLAFGGGYYKGNQAGQAEVQQAWDKEKAAQLAEYAKAQDEARKKEQEMQARADKLRQEKDREVKELAARNAALSNSLRNRAERPAQTGGVPQTAGTGQSRCTGKELYREDGEFLVRIAREADELRIALRQCYKQDEIRNN